MAVLVSQDWHPPKDHAMDSPAANPSNPPVPRQRVSPSNDPPPASSRVPAPQNHQYPYPVQQQQAGWNAHAQPFYPAAFYQNPHQQPFPIHPSQQGQVPPHGPFFDPNAQFAQWAYQQMMFNAQQQAHQLSQHGPPSSSQRGRSNPSSPVEFFAQNQLHNFSPFPSGTPPPHASQLPNGYRPPTTSNGSSNSNGSSTSYDGFHPYRRPNHRQATPSPSDQPATGDWRQQAIQPPYARADAAGSTTSVNSTGSGSRQRTSSLQGSSTGTSGSPHHVTGNSPTSGSVRSRNGPSSQQQVHTSTGSTGRNGGNPPTSTSTSSQSSARPHHRNPSSSSSTSSVSRAPHSGASVLQPSPRPARPSPLSQGMSTAEKRMSRDDSELLEPLPSDAAIRSGGLKDRLRRVLSLNASHAIAEEESSSEAPSSASPPTGQVAGLQSNAADAGDTGSTTTKQAKKKRTALFNSRLNASTDNISLSSTMSSASMVIRKLGSIGKLARRNSLAGITSLFKDKKDKDDAGENSGRSKKKKGGKGEAAEASVSHVTAELDRSSSEWGGELNGLSPAAKLARQHTLKTNAEAAARAQAQEEAAAAAAAATAAAASATSAGKAAEHVPATWEKNTTTNRGTPNTVRVNEDGMPVVVEDDDSGSEGESEHPQDYSTYMEGWEDEDWSHIDDDEDLTIRQGLERTSLGDDEYDHEPWAIGLRRSVERTRQPSKGILKNADGYDQHTFMDTPANYSRLRSNSYNSHPAKAHELGPLARIPSPNPDHIDGLRHPTASSGQSAFLPTLSFEDEGSRHSSERTLFNHPNLNSSAPVLSTVLSSPPTLAHRSATTPVKRLAFANNLSVYDTFPSSMYDRRSEPATWSRLTPALAQRIKEELNSFKMEEMEVHAASRIHTQFFV